MNKPIPDPQQTKQTKIEQRRQDCRDAILARLDEGSATIRELDKLGFEIQEVSFAIAELTWSGIIQKQKSTYERTS